jgi:hypothetical protein
MEVLIIIVALLVALALAKKIIEKLRIKIPVDLDELFEKLEKYNTQDAVKIRLFHKKILFLNKPELIQKVLATEACLEKPLFLYKLMCLNKGLLVSRGKKILLVYRICKIKI